MIVLADDLLKAEMVKSNSTMLSLTGGHVDYIIKTSFPLQLVLILTEISPSLNFLIYKSERFILKRLQISVANY